MLVGSLAEPLRIAEELSDDWETLQGRRLPKRICVAPRSRPLISSGSAWTGSEASGQRTQRLMLVVRGDCACWRNAVRRDDAAATC